MLFKAFMLTFLILTEQVQDAAHSIYLKRLAFLGGTGEPRSLQQEAAVAGGRGQLLGGSRQRAGRDKPSAGFRLAAWRWASPSRGQLMNPKPCGADELASPNAAHRAEGMGCERATC